MQQLALLPEVAAPRRVTISARITSPATTVMSVEARVAFRLPPSPDTLSRLRAVLARA